MVQDLTVYKDQESRIYIPDIKDATKKIFDETPGLAQMEYNYKQRVSKFVYEDVFARSPKEQSFVLPPAAFFLVSQAIRKLPLMCVIDQVYFDRLVSHIIQRSIAIRKDRVEREEEKQRKEAEKNGR